MLNQLCYLIVILLININNSHRITYNMMLPMGPNIRWGEDCPGNDLYHFRTSPMPCLLNCVYTKYCTHVLWNTTDNGTCWLKKGSFSLTNTIKTDDIETMCAINQLNIDENNPIKQFNGNTTYQWQCNIPKCTRKALILRSDQTVKVCRNDGYTLTGISKMITISSIWTLPVYYPSYMCNDQQPWIINDKLAYGYASILGDKLQDINYCCTCYQLHFTDYLIKDKKMIVQIIDHENSFNNHMFIKLFIPGNAIDIYQCNEQWKKSLTKNYEYPSNISSRQQCFNLPKSIQNGCLFRFDWINNSQNLQTIYTKVNCPQELIQRSGCYQGFINN